MVKIERTFPAPNSLATEAKKNSGKYDDGIIDCCVQDPEEMINFKLVGEDVVVMAKDVTDDKAALTAALVYDVFNLRNTGMRVYKSEVRFQQLNKEMNKLYDALEEFHRNPDSKVVLRKLRAMLRRESAFAAFKRTYIRENKEKFPQLMAYTI